MDNIPKGYKKTEIGMIPEDWRVNSLGEIGDVKMCRRIFSYETREFGDIPFYKIGTFGKEPDAYISKEQYQKYKKLYDFPVRGDILISASGTIGRTVVYDGKDAYFQDSNIVWIDNDERLVTNGFLNHMFKRVKYDTEGGTIQRLYNSILKAAKIPLPSIPEQTQISKTLTDIDTFITSLEKLIEKKKMLKQGVMQELLTGKRRLAGFSGEWEKLPLSDVTWFQEGPGVRTSQFTQSGVKLFNGSNINNNEIDLENTNRFISDTEAYGMYAHFLADDGDVVIASSGITIDKFEEKVSLIRREHLPLCMNTSTIRFKVKDRLLERDFLYFFLQSTDFKVQIGGQATGSAQLNFGPSHLEKVFIRYPSDMTEQRELTKIIKDIEMELSISVEKLSKLKQIKLGAMQQLLTGKIRLINK